jgi:AMMECR1 domain-containing protein
VFLPQVPPAFGWNLETTLEQLSLKAGLLPDAWKSSCEFEVFEGFEIQEH